MGGKEDLDLLHELFGKEEELDEELVPYYEENGPLGCPAIRHPLCYSIVHHPAQNAMVNRQLHAKLEELDRATAERDYLKFVYLHERPYRLDAFTKLLHFCEMNDHGYWILLSHIWTDSENIWQNIARWREYLSSDRPYRNDMMDGEELDVLYKDLDDTFTVYRGFCERGTAMGLSWTTNKITAKFFARRLAQPDEKQYLATGQVDRTDVLGFFDGRSETEVVVLPENVRGIKVAEVERKQ